VHLGLPTDATDASGKLLVLQSWIALLDFSFMIIGLGTVLGRGAGMKEIEFGTFKISDGLSAGLRLL